MSYFFLSLSLFFQTQQQQRNKNKKKNEIRNSKLQLTSTFFCTRLYITIKKFERPTLNIEFPFWCFVILVVVVFFVLFIFFIFLFILSFLFFFPFFSYFFTINETNTIAMKMREALFFYYFSYFALNTKHFISSKTLISNRKRRNFHLYVM